jgi:hypothetical protein
MTYCKQLKPIFMAKRKPLTKKLRFEVFKRDSFTCQYCGRQAPDVVLQVDHIEPVSKDGTNDLLNLITSCGECNAGKSDRQLSDNAVLDKQRQQLKQLQERKEQIEMMRQWQKGLLALKEDVTEQLADFWAEQISGFHLNKVGKQELKKLVEQFEPSEIVAAMDIAVQQYVEYQNVEPTSDSVETAWQKVGGICRMRRKEANNPSLSRLFYIRGILRNRLNYCNERLVIELPQEAVDLGADIDSLETHAKAVGSWTQWRDEMEDLISSQQDENEELDDEQLAN